ncbi:sorting nexin [Anaeramoeba flamelloides]|uniref:Sorting nexin n=1 Tax=Anaeramoeba flamelloides TaxID=1746091 RepID=A0ABQ8XYC8_9EUKA|nr:sorting nexin [Anaeramoeba flamelloides]
MFSQEQKSISIQDYHPLNDDELRINYGDIVAVLQEDPSGWWVGQIEQEIGFFPHYCVKYLYEKPKETTIKNEINTNTNTNKNTNTDFKSTELIDSTKTDSIEGNIKQFKINNDFCWEQTGETFKIEVTKSGKKGKYKGIKKYTAYEVISGSYRVSRRYKHFLWLRARMIERYIGIAIPPLPEKQVQGRFTEDFIAKRRFGLSIFLNRCSNHPVLCSCPILKHFLQVEDFTLWKKGKRRIEKENKSNPPFYKTVKIPDQETNMESILKEFNDFRSHLIEIEKKLKIINGFAYELVLERYKEYSIALTKFGSAWKTLTETSSGQSGFSWRKHDSLSRKLEKGMNGMGKNLENIGKMWMNLSENEFYEIVQLFKQYIQYTHIFTEFLKRFDKFDSSLITLGGGNQPLLNEKKNLKKERSIKIAIIIKTEVDLFYRHRMKDFQKLMKEYARRQIEFHRKIVGMWENVSNLCEEIPDPFSEN